MFFGNVHFPHRRPISFGLGMYLGMPRGSLNIFQQDGQRCITWKVVFTFSAASPTAATDFAAYPAAATVFTAAYPAAAKETYSRIPIRPRL